jgi:hemerythrin
MALIQWSDKLSVGIPAMDEQHKELVRMTNELHAAMLERKAREVIGGILGGLAEYTKKHFWDEEVIFTKQNIPGLLKHKKLHAEFVATVEKFQRDFSSGSVTLSLEVMNFLKDWLVNHIQGADQEYNPSKK